MAPYPTALFPHSIPLCSLETRHRWLSLARHEELRPLRWQDYLFPAGSPKPSSYLLCSRFRDGRLRHCVCHSAHNQPKEVGLADEGQGQEAGALSSLPEDLQLTPEHEDNWKWRTTARELVAYGLMFAAVPIGSVLPRLQYSGAIYFVFLALWSVYVGSHRSLHRNLPQKMSFKQGLAVPIMCSISLFGFYCLLRFYPDLDLRTFVSIYLGFAGSLAVASNLVGPVQYILPEKESFSWRINIPQWLLQDEGHPVHFTVTAADCISLLAGIGAAIASKQAEAPFTINNFIAVCIVTELLNLLSLGRYIY